MEISDFIKILFGALMGLGATWFLERLKQRHEIRKLHRDKLETLYEDVCKWVSNETEYAFNQGNWNKVKDRLDRTNFGRMEMLIRFYAIDLLPLYKTCSQHTGELLVSVLLKDEIRKSADYNKVIESINSLKEAIANESKKYTNLKESRWLKKIFNQKP